MKTRIYAAPAVKGLNLMLLHCLCVFFYLFGAGNWVSCDLEKIHLQFIKSTLGVRKQTPTPAIYGDTGRFPLIIRQLIKAVQYIGVEF